MNKIFLLLMISMITACGFGNSGGGSGGSISIANLYLGTDFTIDSLHGQKFKNDRNTLNYSVDDVNPTGQNADDIARNLRNAITTKHGASNFTSYYLGSHKIIGDIVDHKILIITFPVETFDRNNSNNKINGTYSFTIKFSNETTPPPPSGNLDFSLGDDFTINSLGGKPFNSHSPTTYVVDNIDSTGKIPNQILLELRGAIEAKLDENSNIIYKLGGANGSGNIAPNGKYVFNFPITIKEKNNIDNIISDTYSFTINFIGNNPSDKLDFYLGDGFTIANIGNQPFISPDKSLTYKIDNVDPKYKDSDVIRKQLETAIHSELGSRYGIGYTLTHRTLGTDDHNIDIRFDIIITENNTDNEISGGYVFTINFSDGVIPPPSIELSFYLGDEFTIDSIGNNILGTSGDKQLIYSVINIDSTNINNNTVATELKTAIEKVHNANTDITYVLGGSVITDDIKAVKKLVVTFPIKITAKNNPSNSIEGNYSFVISFKEEILPPPANELDFNLGNNLTINSIDGNSFTTTDTKHVLYSVDNISSTSKTLDTIKTELATAINTELTKKTDVNYELGTAQHTGEIGSKKTLIVKFPITLTEKADLNNIVDEVYEFNIKFREIPPPMELSFDLGEDFTIDSLGRGRSFDRSSTISYSASNIDALNESSADLVRQLERSIAKQLNKNNLITHELGEATTSGTVGYREEFIVKFPITITEKANLDNKKSSMYTFKIAFSYMYFPLTFNLGEEFTIDSFYREKFKSKSLLKYEATNVNINNIYNEPLVLETIIKELRTHLEKHLEKANLDSYEIYNSIPHYTGTIGYGNTVTISFGARISDWFVTGSLSASGTYLFTIKFDEEFPLPKTLFDVGYHFSIPSIDNKRIMSSESDSTGLIYNIKNIISTGRDIYTIESELATSIDKELAKKTEISSHTLSNPRTTGTVGYGGEIVTKFDIAITEKENNRTTTGEYVITISFREQNTPWDGTASIEPERDIFDNYLIEVPANLYWLTLGKDNYVYGNIKVLADIDMNSNDFLGIPEFESIFDGDNHTISNMLMYNVDLNSDGHANLPVGLILTVVGDATIKNLTLDGGTLSSMNFVGGVVGMTRASYDKTIILTIDNVTTNIELAVDPPAYPAAVEPNHMGGLIGYVNTGAELIITNSKNTGNLAGTDPSIGGLVGHTSSPYTITGSSNSGKLTSSRQYFGVNIGGIIGIASTKNGVSTITDTYNTGIMDTQERTGVRMGGIIGKNWETDNSTLNIINTYNSSNITTNAELVGGIIGEFDGTNSTLNITDTYNSGNITTKGKVVGGIIGNFLGTSNSTLNITRAYNNSAIDIYNKSYTTAGGIIGLLGEKYVLGSIKATINIVDSSNRGTMKTMSDYFSYPTSEEGTQTGGFIGKIIGASVTLSISNSYNQANIYGNASTNATGGFIGYMDSIERLKIENSYNIGKVASGGAGFYPENERGYISAGGFIGTSYDHPSSPRWDILIINSFNYAEIKASYNDFESPFIARKRGSSRPIFTDLFFNLTSVPTTPSARTGDKTSLTPDDFKNSSKFTNWDFESIWEMLPSASYPTLINNPEVVVTP